MKVGAGFRGCLRRQKYAYIKDEMAKCDEGRTPALPAVRVELDVVSMDQRNECNDHHGQAHNFADEFENV